MRIAISTIMLAVLTTSALSLGREMTSPVGVTVLDDAACASIWGASECGTGDPGCLCNNYSCVYTDCVTNSFMCTPDGQGGCWMVVVAGQSTCGVKAVNQSSKCQSHEESTLGCAVVWGVEKAPSCPQSVCSKVGAYEIECGAVYEYCWPL